MSDPWTVPKSKNYPKNFVVRNDVVFGMYRIKPNEVWNFLANGLTSLEPLRNNYFGKDIPTMQMPAFWSDCVTVEQCHISVVSRLRRFPWMVGRTVTIFPGMSHFGIEISNVKLPQQDQQDRQVFTHYVIWGLKHLLAETDNYKDFLVWDDQHCSWRLPFAFLPATSISPPVFFSLTWRKTEQGWKASATPPYANLIRDVHNRRPDSECLHTQLHASDLAM